MINISGLIIFKKIFFLFLLYFLFFIKNIFFIFFIFAYFFTILLINTINALPAIIYLAIIFINISLIILLLHFEFYALIYFIIYIGAIVVLFLFIILMLDQTKKINEKNTFSFYYIFCLIFINYPIYRLILQYYNVVNISRDQQQFFLQFFLQKQQILQKLVNFDLYLLGYNFYYTYNILLILNGILLLVGIVGPILLTFDTSFYNKKMQSYPLSFYKNNNIFLWKNII